MVQAADAKKQNPIKFWQCLSDCKTRWRESHQVIVWFDAEQISEVAERQRSVGLEAEIGVVVCRGQVASLAAMCKTHKAKKH